MKKNPPTLRLAEDPLVDEIRELHSYADDASSGNTQRAYRSDWRHFELWCSERKVVAMPIGADELALYLKCCVEELGLSVSTTRRKLAALADAHNRERAPFPQDAWIVRNTMRRLRRENGRPARGKAPLLTKDLKKMIGHCPPTLQGARDKALLLLGFAAALRRSELVNLDIEDLAACDEGLILTIRRSKTDQSGEGFRKGIPFGKNIEVCPVKAVALWLEASNIQSGPLFRGIKKNGKIRQSRLSDRVVALIVKKYSGLINKKVDSFAGHSLRAGFATSAAIAGASEHSIQKQTGHANLNVLRRYIREAEMFRDNAMNKIGL